MQPSNYSFRRAFSSFNCFISVSSAFIFSALFEIFCTFIWPIYGWFITFLHLFANSSVCMVSWAFSSVG